MFRLQSLEHPSHPLLGPNLRGLRTFGFLKRRSRFANDAHSLFVIASAAFVVLEIIELYFLFQKGDFNTIMDNLSLTTVCVMCVVKMTTFRSCYEDWCDIVSAVSALEVAQARRQRSEDKKITTAYIQYSRKANYFFWVVCFFTIVMVNAKPLLMKEILRRHYVVNELSTPYPFSVWMPFDAKTRLGHVLIYVMHMVFGFYMAGCLAVWDTTVVSLMIFFRGQLQLLRSACLRIAGADDETVSDEVALGRIRACHQHHIFILKYSKLLSRLISPTMFVYFIVCSVMICAIALQISTQATTQIQTCLAVEYLLAVFIQLFLFYWHSSEVLYQSSVVDRGVYEGDWVGRRALRGDLALLALGLRLPVAFSAGPCNQMTISTFTAILKASYSYFALLTSKSNHR